MLITKVLKSGKLVKKLKKSKSEASLERLDQLFLASKTDEEKWAASRNWKKTRKWNLPYTFQKTKILVQWDLFSTSEFPNS